MELEDIALCISCSPEAAIMDGGLGIPPTEYSEPFTLLSDILRRKADIFIAAGCCLASMCIKKKKIMALKFGHACRYVEQ